MAGRKAKDIGTFDAISQAIREICKSVNTLGNMLSDKECQSRMKMIHHDLIVSAQRIDMLREYIVNANSIRYLIQIGDDIRDATPQQIWKAFIRRWETKNKTFKEDEIWKPKEDPSSPTTLPETK